MWPANVLFDLCGVLFDTEAGTYHPLNQGIELLERCARIKDSAGKPLHTLYVLSNLPKDELAQLQKKFPEIFGYFTSIISAQEAGFSKPDPQIFKYVVNHYKLSPATCILIDDKLSNVDGAQSIGITGLQYTNSDDVTRELKSLGVLPSD